MSKPLKLPTLLVISDNPTIRFWIKKHLDDEFFILFAETAIEARTALNSRLDFIILDANLESTDPLELCKEINLLIQKSLVPIFLITGKLKKSFRDQAQQAGVTDFLSEQLDLEELRSCIAKGEKAASLRDKTVDLALSIKPPKQNPSPNSLKNKFVLNDQGLRVLAEAKKEKTPVALLVIRLDHFNEMEERDSIARKLAQFISDLLPKQHALIPSTEGRLILLLSNTTTEAARMVAEKLQHAIQKHPFKEGKLFTVSIGVSSLEANEKEFSKMIDSAIKSFRTRSETNLIIPLDPENS